MVGNRLRSATTTNAVAAHFLLLRRSATTPCLFRLFWSSTSLRLEKRESRKCTYTASPNSMMQTVYDTEMWSMRKPLQGPPPPPKTAQPQQGGDGGRGGGATVAAGAQSGTGGGVGGAGAAQVVLAVDGDATRDAAAAATGSTPPR